MDQDVPVVAGDAPSVGAKRPIEDAEAVRAAKIQKTAEDLSQTLNLIPFDKFMEKWRKSPPKTPSADMLKKGWLQKGDGIIYETCVICGESKPRTTDYFTAGNVKKHGGINGWFNHFSSGHESLLNCPSHGCKTCFVLETKKIRRNMDAVVGAKRPTEDAEAVRAAKIAKRLATTKFWDSARVTVTDGDNGTKNVKITTGDAIKYLVVSKETIDILGPKFRWGSLKINSTGYMATGRGKVHLVVLKPNPGEIVAHKNDLRHDFNVSNLVSMPQKCNMLCQKTTATETSRGFKSCFEVDGLRIGTKTLSTAAEALHSVDIIKMTHPKVPDNFKQMIFDYGLNRPKEYLQYYGSIEDLQARAELYVKSLRPYFGKESRNIFTCYKSIAEMQDASVPQVLIEALNTALVKSRVPFDPEIDVFLYYKGATGAELATLIEVASYEEHLAPTKRALVLQGGRIRTWQGDLSVVLMKRLGQAKVDGLQVLHGSGKTLDNRVRTYTIGTHRQNMGDVGDRVKLTPLGVFSTESGKFHAKIRLQGMDCHLGRFDNVVDASSAYDFTAQNAKIINACVFTDAKQFRAYVRACARAGKMLPLDTKSNAEMNEST